MNIVIINVYAEGYYSNSEYKEYVVVSEDFYNKNKDKIDKIINKGYYIADLDGKYSEIEADIYVSYIADEDIEEEFWGYERNGEDFYCTMYDKFNKEFENDVKKVKEYIDSLDTYEKIEIRVKKSQMDKLVEFMHKLDNESK